MSRRGILNPRAGEAHFHLARHAPAEDLAFFVERYWIVRWDLRGRDPYESETLPQPCVNMVLERGQSAVHGVLTTRFSKRLSGKAQVFGTKFKAGAFFPFLGRSVADITDCALALPEVFPGADVAALEEHVLTLEDDAPQIALIEAFLRPRLPRAIRRSPRWCAWCKPRWIGPT